MDPMGPPGQPELLQAARRERGWSQSRVADELTGLAVRRGLRVAAPASLKTQISRWENGHTVPEEQYRKLLAALYGQTEQELGLGPAGADAMAPATQAALLADRLATAAAVDDAALALLRDQLESVRRLDRRLGARAAAGSVRSQLAHLELAGAHCLLPDQRRRITALVAETALLAGDQSRDVGAPADAWQCYVTARVAGREAQEPELATVALAAQADVLLDVGRAADGVAAATEAMSDTGEAPAPAVLAWLSTALGRALAAAGEPTAAARAFDGAERQLTIDISRPGPPYIEIDVGALHRSRGHAKAVLGDPGAVPELELGLRTAGRASVRERAGTHVDMVAALRADGRDEEAAEHAREARALTERIGSIRLSGRLDRALLTAPRS